MTSQSRIPALDLARTAAIIGMVAFHFSYDLELFGYLPRGTTTSGFFWYHARMVAGSFLFLSGISLWLAHGAGLRWPAFWRRWAMVAGAALLVSVVSHWTTPQAPIYFGILHAIALTGLVALPFLRLPALVTMAVAALAFSMPGLAASPSFNGLALIWTGLATERPLMADYVPLLPWLAPVLAGVALAKLAGQQGLWDRLRRPSSPMIRALSWPGQHSLAIYLIHQPLLIGGFVAFRWLTM
ncbi:MAG: heparan-alpha-glucosaminide N-acetyltransferase [Paracoccaceae bacterium]